MARRILGVRDRILMAASRFKLMTKQVPSFFEDAAEGSNGELA
jgi:hypothetical protein